MRALNIQEASLLNHLNKNLDELIAATKKGCNLGDRPRSLCGYVSARAKWLKKAIAELEAGKRPERDEDGVEVA